MSWINRQETKYKYEGVCLGGWVGGVFWAKVDNKSVEIW